MTMPIIVNSVLNHYYNPILATVADNLDFASVCHCVRALAAEGTIADPNYQAHKQVTAAAVQADSVARKTNFWSMMFASRMSE